MKETNKRPCHKENQNRSNLRVDYNVIVNITRESIKSLAILLNKYIKEPEYADLLMAVIGRVDIYKTLLDGFNISEDKMRKGVADIVAYLFLNQILFYHIISIKNVKYNPKTLPEMDIYNPPADLLKQIRELFENAVEDYEGILGLHIASIIEKLGDPDIILLIATFISAIKALKPEFVKEDLLGRLFQESIPPETRKNLGAFFTSPPAAKLLTNLAIEKYNERILDPACGSGTLLVEAYLRKMNLFPPEIEGSERHRMLIRDIYGIDVMQFAQYMASINLAVQNISIPVIPNIRVGDGIEFLASRIEGHPRPTLTLQADSEKGLSQTVPREYFDNVIMNPPFTRRERIPEIEKKKLDLCLEYIKGKTGYWAYFIAAADYILKMNGKLAIVTPEEFFAGKSSESLRRLILNGEIATSGTKKKEWVNKYARRFIFEYVIRSGVELAFSEGVLYRDYLVILKKLPEILEPIPLIFVILKKKLEEINEKIEEIVQGIKDFAQDGTKNGMSNDYVDAVKIINANKLIQKHIDNLKPLVGLNSMIGQRIILEILDALAGYPTLSEFEAKGILSIRAYNPGQYITKGVEDEARRLYCSKYTSRGKVAFEVESEEKDTINLRAKRTGSQFSVKRVYTVLALRTYSNIKHMDITGEEEFALINPSDIPEEMRVRSGLSKMERLTKAADDIKKAHEELSSRILLARRVQITSPNIYWLAWYSDNTVISNAVLLNAKVSDLSSEDMKILVLFLNSSLSLLQLLGFCVETRGAWVNLHKDQVWSHLHVPDLKKIPATMKSAGLKLFQNISKQDGKTIYGRYTNIQVAKNTLINREIDRIQEEIDTYALELLGLKGWDKKLAQISSAIRSELEIMQKILDDSSKKR